MASTKKTHLAQVVEHGEAIQIPKGLSLTSAIEILQRKQKEDEEVVSIKEEILTFPWDGAHAFMEAMKQRYGFCTAAKGSENFLISVEVGYKQSEQIVWGAFSIPPIPRQDGNLECGAGLKDGRLIFQIRATVRKKFASEIRELAELTRKIVRERSIYKGKAIKLEFVKGSSFFGGDTNDPNPKFLPPSILTEADMVFPREVEAAVATNLYVPIERMDEVRSLVGTVKRGVLLAGDYGVGKTLVAAVTQGKATANGITFILCENSNDFAQTLQFAQQYAPAVVFCEDIDRVTAGERDVDLDDILNTIDGIESKSGELIVVLTTNHVEKINKAMLRAGRLDAVIHIRKPDVDAVERLLRLYGKDEIAPEENLGLVASILQGQQPAMVRECVSRGKLYALRHTPKGKKVRLTAEALLESAETMQMQIELLNRKEPRKLSDVEAFGVIVGGALKAGIAEAMESNPQVKTIAAEMRESNHHATAEAFCAALLKE